MADDRVDIVFGAEFDQLVAGVGAVRDQLQSLSAPVASVGEQFTLAGMAMEDAPKEARGGWTSAMSGIERDVNGALRGVLSGTETWRQAMGRLFVDLEVSFADMVVKMMMSWAMSGLGLGGGAASGGGGGGILGGGLAGMLGGLFGGGASGGGEEGGADIVGSLTMFQAGAWSIPRDMIAMVHAGEMILPADMAAMARLGASVPPFAGAAAGGGGVAGAGLTLNVSVQAMDAVGVAQWANANARTLAGTIAKYMASNPSTGGQA